MKAASRRDPDGDRDAHGFSTATGLAGRLAQGWTRHYTRGLDDAVRQRRLDEIASDVHEHLTTSPPATATATALAVTWRVVRGMPADLTWRRQERRAMRTGEPLGRPTGLHAAWAVLTQSWFAPVAVLVGLFDLLAAVGIAQEESGKMPGQVIGPVIMTLLAISLFGGLWLRWRAEGARSAAGHEPVPGDHPSTRRMGALVVALVVAVAFLVVGASTGAVPVFFGAVVVLGSLALFLGGRMGVRALRSSDLAAKGGLAEAMIIVGTLPALAFFWMVVPALLAIVVIAGLLGSSPRFRTV